MDNCSFNPYILLVDDDPSNVLFLEELLFGEGYNSISAESGNQALEIVQDSIPDLILLDVMMPDLDGFEVCQQLRQDFRLKTVPILFLTALDDDESRLKGIKMMGDDYLTKPINSDLLLAKIKNILSLNKIRKQASRLELKQQTQQQVATAWQISEHLSEKFRLFVPEQFLSRIAPNGVDSIQVGNVKEAEVSILFCDIRSFTTISESQEAMVTFKWLNALFSELSQEITNHHGFIDKFLGDALMAVFDRPDCHAQDAIIASINMQKKLITFNNKRQQYHLQEPIKIGTGIHSGKVLIGTIGSQSRMDSTVIGDVVNTAARLEELTKKYQCSIVVSEEVITQLNQPHLFRYSCLDQVTLRGKKQPIEIYQILGFSKQLNNSKKINSTS
jgi:adenylate cyclase